MNQVRVALQAGDPLSYEGLASFLRSRPEFDLLPAAAHAEADVLVFSAERLSVAVVAALRRSAVERATPVVLVAEQISEKELFTAIDCRVVAILPRPEVTADRLARGVRAAHGGGAVMPPNLVAELLKHIERLQREALNTYGPSLGGLTTREIDVLRLMANGLSTGEVASSLCYSERTVKNVIHDMTRRLQLRNRLHAVAYAVRIGVI